MKYLIIKRLSIILLFFSLSLIAQDVPENISDADLTKFMEQASSSGMSEAEIKAAALAKGVSVSEIQSMIDRVNTMKKGKVASQVKTSSERLVDIDESDVNPKVKKDSIVSSRIFGADIFRNSKISFEPNIKLPTPKGYILGPGDEILVDISGYASVHYSAKVSTEGSIRIENLSPIYVNGLSIEQASDRIISRLKGIFGGLNTRGGGVSADVSLGSIRSIKVMIIGEAVQPGTFTLPSLATVFNALYACGGPTDKGSFRAIEVYRNGKPFKKIDIYDFLMKGEQKGNFVLQDQDLIRIPYYVNRIDIQGEVLNAKTFEFENTETLGQILNYAGGFSPSAYTKSLTVLRANATNREILTLLASEIQGFTPKNGDSLIVAKVAPDLLDQVSISGSVYRDVKASILKAGSVLKLIELAGGLKPEAYLPRALIKRSTGLHTSKFIAFDLGALVSGKIPDIGLEGQDSVVVTSNYNLRDKWSVDISGAIVKPNQYRFVENMTVADLVFMAGGFAENAEPEFIEISRRIKSNTELTDKYQDVELKKIKLRGDLGVTDEDNKFVLEPFDKVYVYASPRYSEQKYVTITGEVSYPGQYAIKNKSERISDLILRAGGLKPDAYLHGARFLRGNKIVGIDIENILNNASDKNNLLLIKGDSLEVPRIKETVAVSGEVLNATTVGFTGSQKLKDYIYAAGGFTDSARVKKVYVRYANGKVAQTKSFSFFKKYPKIENGAEIVVPVRRKRSGGMSTTELIGILSGLATISTLMYTILRSSTPSTTTEK